MIILRANSELKHTFEKLIKTMGANVAWNGLFVVIDNCLILQGAVRSLFFHFDSRKVLENIIDLPVKEEDIRDTDGEIKVQDAIHMILYSFGKWGTIKGLRVEKNEVQLNRLFSGVLAGTGIDPEYTREHFQFYQDGIRVTYEDVIQAALEAREQLPQEQEQEEQAGLWRKIVWKKAKVTFDREETTLQDRRSGRLGNNFYRIGYLCPDCGELLHMVVYPRGREFKIETPEGEVLLARACTCAKCNSFFTPRPEKMLSEGDIYRLDFEEDRKAYEDYLELLGKQGERVANYRCNMFADGRKTAPEQQEDLEEACEDLENCGEEDLLELSDKMEEGFFSDESIARCERKVREQLWLRGLSLGRRKPGRNRSREDERRSVSGKREQGDGEASGGGRRPGNGRAAEHEGTPGNGRVAEHEGAPERGKTAEHGGVSGNRGAAEHGGEPERGGAAEYGGAPGIGTDSGKDGIARAGYGKKESFREQAGKTGESLGGAGSIHPQKENNSEGVGRTVLGKGNNGEDVGRTEPGRGENGEGAGVPGREGNGEGVGRTASERETEEIREKYEARFRVLDRLSERQLSELKMQLSGEEKLPLSQRQEYLQRIEERQGRQKAERLNKKIDSCAGKNYAVLKRVYEEIRQEELPVSMKEELLERLSQWMKAQAESEVRTLMEKMPPNLDRARYKAYEERIRGYEEADLAPYEEKLRERRRAAEQQEVANLVNRARKSSRSDITALMEKLKQGDYLQEIADAYLEKLEERLRRMDSAAVEELLGDTLHMGFEEAMEAYDAIGEGDFLPEIRENALKMLEKRLSKIKTDECELLVKKLQEELQEAGISENEKHHFYPARKVLLKQALPEETEVIDFALASYAAGRGPFEYPVFVVDSTRNGSGKEGMILTPEHLYYSNLLTSFGMEISSVDRITASTGLLNRGLYVRQKNGTKTKIPYAVDGRELTAYAQVLNDFVGYLQEKPDSRNISYLAKEKHDTICCFRCGYVYKGGTECPKCGYKNNE